MAAGLDGLGALFGTILVTLCVGWTLAGSSLIGADFLETTGFGWETGTEIATGFFTGAATSFEATAAY